MEEIIATFDKCPSCGSTKRVMETLVNESREKKLIMESDAVVPCAMQMGGFAMSPRSMPIIGAKFPGAAIITDVCLDCGTVYATKIVRMDVVAGVGPPPQRMPGLGKS